MERRKTGGVSNLTDIIATGVITHGKTKTGGVSNLTDIIATGVIAHGTTEDGRSVKSDRHYCNRSYTTWNDGRREECQI